jgi:hypothetical protein
MKKSVAKKKMDRPVPPIDSETTNPISKARLLLGKDGVPVSRAELGRRIGLQLSI